MSLVIEDGTNVSGANSYVTDNEYVSYASARGMTISTTSVARQIELIEAMDYLFNKESSMRGVRTLDAQTNIYPRENVYIRGVLLANNAIPTELKNAQMEAGIAAYSFDLLRNESIGNVQKKKLDVMETSYFDGGSWEVSRVERVDNYLKPLLTSGNFSKTVRQ